MNPIIPYGTILPAGSSVIAGWPPTTVLPGDDALQAAVEPFGEPFKFSYLFKPHVGVKLARDTNSTEIGAALATVTAGNAPALFAVPPGGEDAVDIEIEGEIVKEGVEDAIGGLRDLTKAGLEASSSLPWLVGAAIVGAGLVVIGAVVYFKRKK
jgi:hypothetical protein